MQELKQRVAVPLGKACNLQASMLSFTECAVHLYSLPLYKSRLFKFPVLQGLRLLLSRDLAVFLGLGDLQQISR